MPKNWDEIKQRLIQPRASLSPSKFSDPCFEDFERANARAFDDKQVINSVIPVTEGKMGDGRCVVGDMPFNNLDHLTDGTIAPGKPDLFYGARPEKLNQRIRMELSGRIIPSTQNDLPIAPNFFLETKDPESSTAVAKRQLCYCGALGARGMQDLQSYRETEPVYDGNACTITSIYVTTFRQGATAYRNARDRAKEKRDELIEAVNGRLTNIDATSTSTDPLLAQR